uniref:Helicase ATP-binding domain-containing protein n=1 Tax=Macrostomum lignano TaxID=282301 RepID=A0A1I8JQB3_9PLAT
GVVQSLSGKLEGTRMGDRAYRSKPTGVEEKQAKRKEAWRRRKSSLRSWQTESPTGGVLATEDDGMRNYESLLHLHSVSALGDEPRDVLCGAADEVLAAMKETTNCDDKERKREIESLLGNLGQRTPAANKAASPVTQQAADIDETYGVMTFQFEDFDSDEDARRRRRRRSRLRRSQRKQTRTTTEGAEGAKTARQAKAMTEAPLIPVPLPAPRRPQFVDVKLPDDGSWWQRQRRACTRQRDVDAFCFNASWQALHRPGCRAGQSGRMPAAVEVGWGRSGSGKSTSRWCCTAPYSPRPSLALNGQQSRPECVPTKAGAKAGPILRQCTCRRPKPKPFDATESLIKISSLPAWCQPAFPSNVSALNRVQSRIMKTAMESDENMLLCAPTGSGKTICALLTMLRTIGQHRDPDAATDAENAVSKDDFKIIYIAPMRSLAQ